MSVNKQQELQLPDFIGLKAHFDNRLTPGQRAELRRVCEPDEIDLVPAYYHLIKNFLPAGGRPDRRWKRVVYLLPYAAHAEGASSLGSVLARADMREARLFQMIRSDEPNDLMHLRRMLQQVKPSLDWSDFGKSLYLWGKRAKQRILEDYCLNSK